MQYKAVTACHCSWTKAEKDDGVVPGDPYQLHFVGPPAPIDRREGQPAQALQHLRPPPLPLPCKDKPNRTDRVLRRRVTSRVSTDERKMLDLVPGIIHASLISQPKRE